MVVNDPDQLYEIFLQHREIATDSRNVSRGSLFFALKGEHFDGNRFALQALENGAAMAVVDDPRHPSFDRIIRVDDGLAALQSLACYHRGKLKTTVIGITGSNGKTTTKELTHAILSRKYACEATKGNLNNHIGVPLTLLSLHENLDFAIIEMGANHGGEIADLCRMADPRYGLITNVGKAHLEGFGSFEGVVAAKTELYQHLRKNGGKGFVNAHNNILVGAAGSLPVICFGKQGNDVSGEIIQSNPSLKMICTVGGKAMKVNTNLVGAYNFENILAAASIGFYFGVGPEDIKAAIEDYFPQNNRSQVIQTPKNTLIMDAYNANPSSMEAAILNFAEGDYDNKALLLGEMRELGTESEQEHARIIDLVTRLGFNRVYLVGSSFHAVTGERFNVFDSTGDLIDHIKKYPVAGFTILVKGSRGNKLETLIHFL